MSIVRGPQLDRSTDRNGRMVARMLALLWRGKKENDPEREIERECEEGQMIADTTKLRL